MLLAGSSNYDDGSTNGNAVGTYELPRPSTAPGTAPAGEAEPGRIPDIASATGPLAMADVDGDGALDLFVGGRSIPGRWPESASSRLFLQRPNRWVLETNATARLTNIGLVTSAVFTDLDADGAADLVLACEWGALRIFRNRHGTLESWDPALKFSSPPAAGESGRPATLSQLSGFWTGITAGDFDGDGRMDIVAGNWGRNTRLERHRARPLQLYYGDLNRDGSVAIVEAGYDSATKQFMPLFSLEKLARGMPWLLERFATAEAFARASVIEALGDRVRLASHWEAAWFDSTVFLNRGDYFEVRSLPLEAQFAPAFGVCVADFDGDGAEDIFLAQNFFGARPEHSRLDAGRGLLLRNDGRGNFKAVPAGESGIEIYGEQRGAAAGDFDGDGRVDLVVGQNSGSTELFRNVTARPGLRVRLRGGAGNPEAIGAVMRVTFQDGRLGPARELHRGSGWLSCDSPVTVLAMPVSARALHIRWPDGRETVSPLAAGVAAVTVNSDGTLAP